MAEHDRAQALQNTVTWFVAHFRSYQSFCTTFLEADKIACLCAVSSHRYATWSLRTEHYYNCLPTFRATKHATSAQNRATR
jgi:hypothetical protein